MNDASEPRVRFEAAFDEFRSIVPIALCYGRIVPVDEVVTLTLFHREDDPLHRLVLSEVETRELDLAWEDLLFVSHAALKQVDVFEQFFKYAIGRIHEADTKTVLYDVTTIAGMIDLREYLLQQRSKDL